MLLELGFEGGGAVVRGCFGRGAPAGLLRLMLELLVEPVDLCSSLGGLIGRGADVSLRLLELRLELSDPLACTLCVAGRCRLRLFELGRELLSSFAVLGGFGAGDVDKGLEVGRGVRVLLDVRFEFGGAFAGVVGGCVGVVEVALEPVCPLTVLHGFGG